MLGIAELGDKLVNWAFGLSIVSGVWKSFNFSSHARNTRLHFGESHDVLLFLISFGLLNEVVKMFIWPVGKIQSCHHLKPKVVGWGFLHRWVQIQSSCWLSGICCWRSQDTGWGRGWKIFQCVLFDRRNHLRIGTPCCYTWDGESEEGYPSSYRAIPGSSHGSLDVWRLVHSHATWSWVGR